MRGGRTTQHWSIELAQNGSSSPPRPASSAGAPSGSGRIRRRRPKPSPAKDVMLADGRGRPSWVQPLRHALRRGDLMPFPRNDGVIRVRVRSSGYRTIRYRARPISDAFFVRRCAEPSSLATVTHSSSARKNSLERARRRFGEPMATITMTTRLFPAASGDLVRGLPRRASGDMRGARSAPPRPVFTNSESPTRT